MVKGDVCVHKHGFTSSNNEVKYFLKGDIQSKWIYHAVVSDKKIMV